MARVLALAGEESADIKPARQAFMISLLRPVSVEVVVEEDGDPLDSTRVRGLPRRDALVLPQFREEREGGA